MNVLLQKSCRHIFSCFSPTNNKKPFASCGRAWGAVKKKNKWNQQHSALEQKIHNRYVLKDQIWSALSKDEKTYDNTPTLLKYKDQCLVCLDSSLTALFYSHTCLQPDQSGQLFFWGCHNSKNTLSYMSVPVCAYVLLSLWHITS